MRETILLVFFDLPMKTCELRRAYRRFRSGLKNLGYVMFQKSVYYKLITNVSMYRAERDKIKQIIPTKGDIQCLPIPLGQFTEMSCLLGEPLDFSKFLSPMIEI